VSKYRRVYSDIKQENHPFILLREKEKLLCASSPTPSTRPFIMQTLQQFSTIPVLGHDISNG